MISPPLPRVRRTCMGALLLAGACGTARPSPQDIAARPATPLEEGTAVMRYPAGPFVVMEERYTRPREEWAPHVARAWTKIHLSFDAPGGHVSATLTDDGSQLRVAVRTAECVAFSDYLQYSGEHPDQRHLYEKMEAVVGDLMQACTRDREALRQALPLLQRARRDFPAALEVMKSRVSEVFGATWTRCGLPPVDVFQPCRPPKPVRGNQRATVSLRLPEPGGMLTDSF